MKPGRRFTKGPSASLHWRGSSWYPPIWLGDGYSQEDGAYCASASEAVSSCDKADGAFISGGVDYASSRVEYGHFFESGSGCSED